MKMTSWRLLGLGLAVALFACVMVVDRAEAQAEYVVMELTPATNFAGTVAGTDVYYLTSNGKVRRVFIAENCKSHDQDMTAVYIGTTEMLKGYRRGGSHDLWK